MAGKLSKNFDALEKEDMVKLIAMYNSDVSITDTTKADYRRALKQFYRWYKEEDVRLECEDKQLRLEAKKVYKYIEKDVSVAYKKVEADPNTIIDGEDCQNIVEKFCRTNREKAFISTLHESGCRAGEFLNIKLGNIGIKDNYAELIVDGKTGKRTIFIVKSLPYLLRYLDCHPYKDNKLSYLWLSDAQHNKNEPLLHKGAQKLIDRCFERASIKKKHNLHWFRHSRGCLKSLFSHRSYRL